MTFNRIWWRIFPLAPFPSLFLSQPSACDNINIFPLHKPIQYTSIYDGYMPPADSNVTMARRLSAAGRPQNVKNSENPKYQVGNTRSIDINAHIPERISSTRRPCHYFSVCARILSIEFSKFVHVPLVFPHSLYDYCRLRFPNDKRINI